MCMRDRTLCRTVVAYMYLRGRPIVVSLSFADVEEHERERGKLATPVQIVFSDTHTRIL